VVTEERMPHDSLAERVTQVADHIGREGLCAGPGRCQQADTYLVGQVTDRRIATGQADTTN
jgi:hypothetical protein